MSGVSLSFEWLENLIFIIPQFIDRHRMCSGRQVWVSEMTMSGVHRVQTPARQETVGALPQLLGTSGIYIVVDKVITVVCIKLRRGEASHHPWLSLRLL